MRIELLRGVTIADPAVYDRSKGGDPPTFSPGDVIDVALPLAQELVGNGKARYVRDGDSTATTSTATVSAPEDAAMAPPRVRKAVE